ncbi:uncharacterized protein LOC123869187 isoform X3 [Maniola jurtina]|uniref:uncharacterized protein LOC123869187 isoform X3 n=1 Tax=Maniola jurtina TaxID=191418 RepID=UPI001E68E664|nr:uncharacterized protein LOC123869187 isoform X3 [Maniola jurtina]
MSDPRSKELIKLRGSIKGKLTIFQNFVNSLDKCDHISETQYNELECRLSKIDSLQNDFDKFQTELEILSDDTSQLLLEREEFDTKYFSLVAEARTIMNRSKRHLQRRMSVSEASEGSESRDGGFHDFVRLPKISLPSFDGEKMTQWLEFRDTYLSLIHSNNNLGNINKFHYLRAALKGSALTVIKNLEFTSKNYEVAWQLLSSRYDNERLLVNIHVNSLLNFSTMTKESGKSLRNLVDTINRNLCALNTLGQPTDHWDTLVIHLMSRKLDSVTFREWEEHRNSITTSPTLKQFIDFLIGRADLLDTIQLEETQRQSTSQTNQNTQFTQNKHNTQSKNISLNKEKITLKTTACPLCTQNHFLFSCSEFRKLSVDERLEKMKNFSVCKNCLRPGHKDSQCRLTHCKYCSLKHSTLLHKDTEQHTTVALSANIQTSNKPLTLLSTALVNVVGADGKLHPARALLDNASTGHYVTQHLCEKLGLLRRSVSSSVTVKALHLELVTDLTKEAFISAFLKFISRRGKPMSVTSDNSTTFIGASNEIASFFSKYSDDIKSDLSNRDIEFRRIPQYTPHFGGLWESAVKSVKFHLKRILNLTHLTYEEMTTCLVQIEAILNSRPLTPLSSDPSDLTCLTPAHFLIGRSLLSVPRPMVSDTNIAAMDRYQRIEALKQHFWRRFSAEYVSLLQQRMKWQRGSITSLQLGSLVLVKDRTQPPLLWLLGRVEKVHPGQDGVARVAEIKTKKGVITRAFNNICPLPISNSRGQDV